MNSPRIMLLSVLIALLFSLPLLARDMEGCWRIELRAGYWDQTNNNYVNINPSGLLVDVPTNSVISGLALSRWISNDFALEFSVGYASAAVETYVGIFGVRTHHVSIMPVLVGVRYYPDIISGESRFDPFVTARLGVFAASEFGTEVGGTVVSEERTEGTFGGYAGIGFDIELGRRFMLGISTGYNFMMDYSEKIGNRDNYGGTEFSIGIGYIFGNCR